jgi:hypothetical protein
MNYLKNAGEIVELSMIRSYQHLSNSNPDYSVQVAAMYVSHSQYLAGETGHRYTVVIEAASVYDYRVAVCYDGALMYIVENPNSKYYEDLNNNNVRLDPSIAVELYND